jgi:cytochrome c oxidase assembly protein Cox11
MFHENKERRAKFNAMYGCVTLYFKLNLVNLPLWKSICHYTGTSGTHKY